MECKTLSKEKCLPPKCTYVNTDKRKFCRSATRKTKKKIVPSKLSQTNGEKPKKNTSKKKKLILKKKPKKLILVETPPQKIPVMKEMKIKSVESPIETDCKKLTKEKCLPPKCTYVNTDKRKFCRSATRKIKKKIVPSKLSKINGEKPKNKITDLVSIKQQKQNIDLLASLRISKKEVVDSSKKSCNSLPKKKCLPPECTYVNTEKRKFCRTSKRKTTTTKTPKPKIIKKTLKRSKVKVPAKVIDWISQFKELGDACLINLERENIGQIIELANRVYVNGEDELMSDEQYDYLFEYAKDKYPDLPQVNNIGIDVDCKGRMQKLPIFMGSLDKIKDNEKHIETFKRKTAGDYIISDKLDGVSAMYYAKMGEPPKLYTRGNGDIGQDISEFIPYIKHLPSSIDGISPRDAIIRGELIISKDKYQEKYADKYKSARYVVARLVISKTRGDKLDDLRELEFIAYQQISPKGTPEEQFTDMRENEELKVAYHKLVKHDELTNDYLSDELTRRREESPFHIDGIVVSQNEYHRPGKGNPKHSFAFKMLLDDQKAESTVTGVEWNPTKGGLLFPRIFIQKVRLPTGSISKISGHNARYIINNGIGVGAKVVVARSGDVIPKVIKVLEPASEPALPTSYEYDWCPRKVNFILNEITPNPRVQIRRIVYFFHAIGGYYLSESTVAKLHDNGFKTVRDFIEMTQQSLLSKKIKGIAKKRAEKIVNVIQNSIKHANPIMLMDATGKIGRNFGPRKMYLISIQYPDAFDVTIPEQTRVDGLLSIKGFGNITAQKFIANLNRVYQFIIDNGIQLPDNIVSYFKEKNEHMDKYLVGVNVVFTGILNNEALENKLLSEGANVQSIPDANTTDVVTGDINAESEKMDLAKELCLPIYTLNQFKDKYNLHMIFDN